MTTSSIRSAGFKLEEFTAEGADVIAHALQRGIRAYTGVAELGWLQQILAFGWDCRPLGAPRNIGGRVLGALAIAIGPDTPALLDRSGIWADEDVAATALSQAA